MTRVVATLMGAQSAHGFPRPGETDINVRVDSAANLWL